MIHKYDENGVLKPFRMNIGTLMTDGTEPPSDAQITEFVNKLKNDDYTGGMIVSIMPYIHSYRFYEGTEQPIRLLEFSITKPTMDELSTELRNHILISNSMVYVDAMGKGLFKVMSRRLDDHIYTMTAYGIESELYDAKNSEVRYGKTPRELALIVNQTLSKYGISVDSPSNQSWLDSSVPENKVDVNVGFNMLSLLYICSLAEDAFCFYSDDRLCFKKYNDSNSTGLIGANPKEPQFNGILNIYPKVDDTVISENDVFMYRKVTNLANSDDDNISSIINNQLVYIELDGDNSFNAIPNQGTDSEVWVDISNILEKGGTIADPIQYSTPNTVPFNGNVAMRLVQVDEQNQITRYKFQWTFTVETSFNSISMWIEYRAKTNFKADVTLNVYAGVETVGTPILSARHQSKVGICPDCIPGGDYRVELSDYSEYIYGPGTYTVTIEDNGSTSRIADQYIQFYGRYTDGIGSITRFIYTNTGEYEADALYMSANFAVNITMYEWKSVISKRIDAKNKALVITEINGYPINSQTKYGLVHPHSHRCVINAPIVNKIMAEDKSIRMYGQRDGTPIQLNGMLVTDDTIPTKIAYNTVRRFKDPSKSIVISMREMKRMIVGNDIKNVWEPSFDVFSYAYEIRDRVNKVVIKNVHPCDSTNDNSLTRLSMVCHRYPECVTEYTFGLTRNTDMTQEIADLQQKNN